MLRRIRGVLVRQATVFMAPVHAHRQLPVEAVGDEAVGRVLTAAVCCVHGESPFSRPDMGGHRKRRDRGRLMTRTSFVAPSRRELAAAERCRRRRPGARLVGMPLLPA